MLDPYIKIISLSFSSSVYFSFHTSKVIEIQAMSEKKYEDLYKIQH